jgi:hypothetical protein
MTWADLIREREAAKSVGFQAGWYAAVAFLLEVMPASPDLIDAVRLAGEQAPTLEEWAERIVNGDRTSEVN